MAEKQVKVTLVKSTIGASPYQKRVVEALGLRKLNHTVLLPDNAQTRGAAGKVPHLVKVEEV
ncbi:MAG: 50S ribosomal protein L30 [Bacillota bacterium]|nr:50S ribosomal protein L30 [Bacillota bacterium]